MEQIFTYLAETLNVDAIQSDDVLESFEEWDSLSRLTIQAMADKHYGASLSTDDLAKVKTASELAQLILSRKKN